MSRKLISFSVYGPFDLYNQGAYENIAEAKEYFPGWICRFYVGADCPILPKLLEEQRNGNCQVVIKEPEKGNKGMFWRFEAMSDDYDYIIIRDTDQRLNDKDAQMVQDWIASGLDFHRAHEEYSQETLVIMGCAFGIKGGVIPNIKELMNDWFQSIDGHIVDHKKIPVGKTHLLYGSDQVFLREKVWPLVEGSCMTYGIHGKPFLRHKPFKWGGDCMYRRIKPFTECKEILGNRPDYAYQLEEKQ